MSLEDAYISGGPAPPPYDNVWAIFMEGVRRNPDGIAIIVMHQSRDHLSHLLERAALRSSEKSMCLEWTYMDLASASLRFAGALHARGVGPGQTMVTFVENSVEWAIARWAAARLGLIFVPCDATMLERKADLEDVIGNRRPRVVLLQNGAAAKAFDGLEMDGCVEIVRDEHADSACRGWEGLEGVISKSDKPLHDTADFKLSSLDQPISILFTSGTTSKPKGCAHTIATISTGVIVATYRAIDETTRYLAHSTNFRAICEEWSLACWRLGATVVVPSERFNPDATAKALALFQCTHMVVVPAQLHALRRSKYISQAVPKQLKRVFIGGDIVNISTIRLAQSILDPVWVAPLYGMTEGSGTMAWQADDQISFTEGGIAGVGHVLYGSAVKVCATGTTTTMKRREKGELHFRCAPLTFRHSQFGCPPVLGRYLGNLHEESFSEDDKGRWFKTGDLAMIDEKGVVFILGRTKDIIKYKGMNLSPAVFKGCLNSILGIEIVDVPHPEYGQVAVTLIKCDTALDAEKKAHLRDIVGKELGVDYFVADVYDLRELGMDEWPMNATGKVVKMELRKGLAKLQKQ